MWHYQRSRIRICITTALLILLLVAPSTSVSSQTETTDDSGDSGDSGAQTLFLPDLKGNLDAPTLQVEEDSINEVGGTSIFLPSINGGNGRQIVVDPVVLTDRLLAGLQLEQQTVESSEAILVQFSLTNISDTPLYVLLWGTPFEGFTRDMFVVTTQDTQVPYIGRFVTRQSPTRESYQLIQPGEQLSTVINLADGYAIESGGQYKVSYKSQFLEIRQDTVSSSSSEPYEDRTLELHEITTSSLSFVQNGNREAHQGNIPRVAQGAACTVTQQATINTAFRAARTLATNAVTALHESTDPREAARYITWFGHHTTARYQTVTTNFMRIRDALNTRTFTWDCNPPSDECSGVNAYVYGNAHYLVHLCPAFFSPLNVGRAGTILHEASHFNVVASTNDFWYLHTEPGGIFLAQSRPDDAVNNADSYEEFAENTANLPMTKVTNPIYVNPANRSTKIGTEQLPYNSVSEGIGWVARGGTLIIRAAEYDVPTVLNFPVTLTAWNGKVTLK